MTLTIQDLRALGELLGSVAVLATLIYLALQTRQNTMAISAQLDAATVGANQSLFLSVATSSELMEAMQEDLAGDMTTNQARRAWFWIAQLLTFQWQLHQAQRGLLPSFNEAAIAATVRATFNSFPSFEDWWEGGKENFHPDFVEWVEEQRSKVA